MPGFTTARLRRLATATPDAPALLGDGQDLSFAALYERVCRAAQALVEERSSGTRPVVVADGAPDAAVGLLATLAAGCRPILLDESLVESMLPGMLDTHGGEARLVVASQAPRTTVPGANWLVVEDLAAGAAGEPAEDRGLGKTEGIVYQLTSGSSGPPKLALVPEGALLRGGDLYADEFALTGHDRVLATVSMAHSFGTVASVFSMLATGAAVGWCTTPAPTTIAMQARAAGITVLVGAPLVFELLASTGALADGLGRLRLGISSGAALDAQVVAALERGGLDMRQVYGSTETGVIAFQDASERGVGATGRVAPDVDVRRHDGVARLEVRTSTMYLGYLAAGDQSDPGDSDLTADGYLRMGDLARVDGSGRIWLEGREATFVNTSGRKVNIQRVRDCIRSLKGVTDCVVYGVDGPLGVEEVWAAAECRDGLTEVAVLRHCRQQLASWEVPTRVTVTAALPRLFSGKVDVTGLPRPDPAARLVGSSSELRPSANGAIVVDGAVSCSSSLRYEGLPVREASAAWARSVASITLPIAEVASTLDEQGYCFVSSDRFGGGLCRSPEWSDLAEAWDRLEMDRYLRGQARFRERRYGKYQLDASGLLTDLPPAPYLQDQRHNAYAGGIPRSYPDLEPTIRGNRALLTLIALDATVFSSRVSDAAWLVDVHQFRILARPGELGLPTPEGVHRDGNDAFAVHLIDRDCDGGVTRVYDKDGGLLSADLLTHPLDTLYVDDNEVLHDVTPIEPAAGSEFAHRDVVIIDFYLAG